MNKFLKHFVAIGLVCLIPLGAVSAQEEGGSSSQPAKPMMSKTVADALRQGRILLNFENIDIRVLARMMSELTGRNLVVDNAVKGKVTILSSREVSVNEAWDIFKTALKNYGYTVQDKGEYSQIISTGSARTSGKVYAGGYIPSSGDDMVMAVLILQHGDPEQIEKAIKPLVSENGVISSYKQGQALVVVEQGTVVNRISQIVKNLDKLDPTMRTEIIFPQYLEADKVVAAIKPLFKEKESDGTFSITAFAPANGVVVSSGPQDVAEVRRIVERLDIPLAAPTKTEPARFFVYHLQFAQAEGVAKILSDMLSERQKAVEQQLKEAKVPANEKSSKSDGNSVADKTEPADNPSDSTPAKTVGFTSSKVSADTETNSLVLYVSPSEYDDLKTVISRLDAERRQVEISAVVAEVALKRIQDVGVNWQALTGGGVIGSFQGGMTEEGLLNVLAGGNFVIGGMSGDSATIEVNNQNVKVPKFFAYISALNNNSDVNLISAPRVLTQDNKQAVINVGQTVPFATGAKMDVLGSPTVTFDYREVGVKLEVTPHLSRTGKIRMDINQEIKEVAEYLTQEMSGVKFTAPVVSNRSVTTTVTVPDGRTLLIGGLISKRTTDTIKGVPILMNLPILGPLFRTKSTDEQKVSIFISITPRIVDMGEGHLEHLDRPLEPFMQHPGLPGDQQYENRDTIAPEDDVMTFTNSDGTSSVVPMTNPDAIISEEAKDKDKKAAQLYMKSRVK